MNARKTKPVRAVPADEAFIYLFKLLIVLPIFQKKVAQLRKYLGMPHGLLPLSPNEESVQLNQAFDLKLDARGDRYLRSTAYRNKKRYLDQRERVGALTPRQYDAEIKKLLAKGLPKNHLQDAIHEIIDLFNLPSNFAEPIKLYVYHGVIQPPKHRYSMFTQMDDGFRRRLVVEIYAPLTDKEKRDFFKKIDRILTLNKQSAFKGYKPRKKADRDIDILIKTALKGSYSNDLDLVGQIFSEESEADVSVFTDKKRRSVIWQARSRVKKALIRCFPPDVIPREWRQGIK